MDELRMHARKGGDSGKFRAEWYAAPIVGNESRLVGAGCLQHIRGKGQGAKG
jgi:hypothetical protein